MLHAPDLSYHVVPSADLTNEDHDQIDSMLWDYLNEIYGAGGEVTPKELMQFVARSSRSRRDPNLAVGGGTLRAGQSYARPVNILAVNKYGDLKAQIPVADNASAPKYPQLPQAAEPLARYAVRQAKLYAPAGSLKGKPLIRSRHIWFGQPAFSWQVLEHIEEMADAEFSIFDAMAYAATLKRHEEQPLSAYTYSLEAEWERTLALAGFISERDTTQTVHPFGSDYEVEQTTWRNPSLQAFRSHLLTKSGADEVMPAIRDGMRYQALETPADRFFQRVLGVDKL